MATLTKAQQLARDHLDGDVLIAAGAGSGKTKVLTERVIKLLLVDHVPLSQFLLLTFTNAAAAEMKSRIRKELIKANQLDLASQIDDAFIMTFDAYALYLVQKHAYALGLGANVGIYEETLYLIEKKLILNTIFDEYYVSKDPAFVSLIRRYVINQDEAFKAFLLRIDNKADLLVDKLAHYRQYLSIYFQPAWKQEQQEALFKLYKKEIQLIGNLAVNFESPEQTNFFYELTQQLIALPTLDDVLLGLKAIEFPRLKPKSISEEDKALRTRLKEDLSLLKVDADMVPIAKQLAYYDDTASAIQVMLNLLLELNMRLELKKKQYQQFPFADIGKMAMSLLNDQDILRKTRQQFRYIMVDEYQDTNNLQEAFLQKIASRNLFMVGDVKQSVYRFRNANSDIFNAKFDRFKDYALASDKHETKIILQDNFRSRPEVLEDINHLFTHVMSVPIGGTHYNHEQRLNFGQQLYVTLKDESTDYHIQTIRYEKSDKNPELNEPMLIAKDIIEKIQKGVEVVDLETKSKRRATFKDFTILIDRKSNFTSYLEVFNQHGIPLEVFAERDLSDSDFFRVMKNLITIMVVHQGAKIPQAYLQAYVSVLRSFLFQEKDQDIYRFALGKRGIDSFALNELLIQFVSLAKRQPLSMWMRQLVLALNLEERLLTLPDLPSNLARLEGWMKMVDQLSGLGYDLVRFESFLKQTTSMEVDLNITASKQTDNAVQLMTIHKSKGLEFPFVYYPGLTKGFNMVETKGMYQYSNRYGIQLPYPEAVYAKPIFADLILNEEKEAILSEQVRLWYVALTRAKEKIILVMESSQPKPMVDLERMRSFADLMQWYDQQSGNVQPDNQWVTLPEQMPSLPQKGILDQHETITFKHQPQSFEVMTTRRASKLNEEDNNEAMLAYGTYLHECLFLLDFTTLDTSFIPVEKDRQLIQRLTVHPWMKQLSNKVKANQVTLLREYAYLDERTGRTGIIDLVIMEGQKITILDYKTSNIEDEAYAFQLQTYADYFVQQGFSIEGLYLLSLTQALIKKIN